MPSLSQRLTPNPDVVETRVGEETVLLHLADGTYFGMDSNGTWIWTRLKAGKTAAQICSELVVEFDTSEEQASADLTAFLAELKSQNILTDDLGSM